jgi:hypothetical protein
MRQVHVYKSGLGTDWTWEVWVGDEMVSSGSAATRDAAYEAAAWA